VPSAVAEFFPMPPRATATEPPTPLVKLQPAPPARPAPVAAPTQKPRRPLPLWIAVGAVAFVLGGAGLYWRSHRTRTLRRLATRLVSNGLDRQAVAVEAMDRPDIGIRVLLRASAAIGAPGTRIELIPAGV